MKVTDDELRLIVWTVMDGCLVKRKYKTIEKEKVHHIQFKLSKQRKINYLRKLLDFSGVPYTFKLCKKTGLNKLQPYYIRIYGDVSRRISEHFLDSVKELPEWFLDLTKKQFKVILSMVAITDGSKSYLKYVWSTTSKNDYDIIRTMCGIHGTKYVDYGEYKGKSGFKNAKTQYHMGFYLW